MIVRTASMELRISTKIISYDVSAPKIRLILFVRSTRCLLPVPLSNSFSKKTRSAGEQESIQPSKKKKLFLIADRERTIEKNGEKRYFSAHRTGNDCSMTLVNVG
jgi:hypothetical protein